MHFSITSLSVKARIFFAVLFFPLTAQNGFSQDNLSFRQLSVNDGLSQNSAISITQDQDGFLWIATQEGLNRYDGRDFVIFNKKFLDITESNRLLLGKVTADSKNRIWIIPESSVPELLDREKNAFFPIDGITSANTMVEDLAGKIWFGTLSGQLYSWNDHVNKAEMIWSDPNKEIVHLSIYDKENLILTFSDETVLWNKESGTFVKLWKPEVGTILTVSKIDTTKRFWFGTLNRGLWTSESPTAPTVSLNTYLNIRYEPGQEAMILDLLPDSKNRLWAATYGNGIKQINLEQKTLNIFSYTKQNPRSIHYNDILSIFEDYTGTLWFGSDGAGLSFYDSYLEKFNFFHNQEVPENINIDVIRAIYVDEFENVWLGTSGKGLTRYNPKSKTWKTFVQNTGNPNSLASNRVMSLLGDHNGKLWIGYQDEGLSIFDLKTERFQHFNSESSIVQPGSTVWKIFQDSQGKFWLCTRNDGLILFDPKKGAMRQFIHDPQDSGSIPDNNIRTMLEDPSGQYWIGTENHGIAKLNLNSGTFERHIHEEGKPNPISSNGIKSLHLDKNILWIGTNGGGLNRMDLKTGENQVLNVESGLSNNVVYSILEDQKRNLWLSSNKGITKIGFRGGFGNQFEITNYSNYDGLATEFNTGAYFKDEDGTLYFGSLDGFYWFNPEDISMNEIPPKIAITDLFAFDQKVKPEPNLQLKHNQNTLTFNMASLVFSSPGKNQFEYMLENHDENWVSNGYNHQARYTNLAPGNYRFLVKASNYDGIWAEKPVSLEFTILSPWYFGTVAKVTYVLLLALLILWIYQYLKWKWHIQFSLRMKDRETQTLKEIDDFKTQLFTNISHEFRTPLTLISGPIDRVMSQTENPVIKSQLNLVKMNSQRLLTLVDQLLEVSKIKSGKNQITIRKGNLGLLLQSIVANFFYQASERGLRLATNLPLMTEVWFDSDKVEKIVKNLVQNAIKYAKKDSEIQLNCFISKGNFHLNIRNESMESYNKEDLSQLFQIIQKSNGNKKGFGLGLSLVKEMIQLYHGEISVSFKESRWFDISVMLPVDKYAFHPDEVIDEESEEWELPTLPIAEGEEQVKLPIVLIVEDNTKVREFIARELSLYFQTLEAENGKEGLFMALKKIPDLIISDVMMPEMDGFELCRKIKNNELTSHIPIILLTAKADEESHLEGIQAGADDFFLKPFKTNQLLSRIKKLIELRAQLRIRYSGRSTVSPKDIAITSTDERFLEKIQEIVDRDLSDSNFTVDEFSKKLGMSRMQLHRKLTALTGLSTTAYMRDQRLRLALPRLEKSGDSISEIAYSVGFSSPSYFIKTFKETYGKTPSEYQERRAKK
ncbi:MAG: two-component regulator propeller domain-containing protein [Algoriphagus sp.]|uniref:hybrid sensor histidine kinase/response regulator transcription factor n=2 Tax=Algoriphagus sp. TaxID=1872435 RepID=UPI0027335426|nr:two-component regulator propeller domain-containing protein [Algoriphagus sp.]MDP3470653.1 two-component regulator propeller domain-containing protein [Algoriphagus sp.]